MRNHNDCLVLNVDYSPIGIIDWRKSMIWAYKHINRRYSSIEIIEYYQNDYIVLVNKNIKVPAVVKTTKFFKLNNLSANFSRKNLFIRDNYTCQYCGYKFSTNKLTYDHVIPKSKWPHKNQSATSWTNIVTACFSCNRKKGSNSPQQANMTLKTQPYIPQKTRKYLHVTHQLLTIKKDIPDEWKLYVGDLAQ